MIVDLDHFKRINDTFGYTGGARESDLTGAIGIAERAREQVESLSTTYHGKRVCLTASVGVASVSSASVGDEVTPLYLLNRAHRALYEAKSAGRNTVWAWMPASPGRPGHRSWAR